MIDNRYLVFGSLAFIVVVFMFSWMVAFGPLYEILAYPGDFQPLPTQWNADADCINNVLYFNGKSVPMTDGVIARDCEGK